MLSIRKNQMTIAQYDKICLVTNTMVVLEVHGKTVKIQGEDLQVFIHLYLNACIYITHFLMQFYLIQQGC